MPFERSAGILLHPTSLPGPWGIGDLGPAAYQWLDWLESAEHKFWQILPLCPTAYGDSPYSGLSAFALNPLLISPEVLGQWGLLKAEELATPPPFPRERVDYGWVTAAKNDLLRRAWQRWREGARPDLHDEASSLWADPRSGTWAYDYALFVALKQAHRGAVWTTWEPDIALREPAALQRWHNQLADEVDFQLFCQFCVLRQWLDLKAYAATKRVSILGDIPIFVAFDSADVWCNRHLFQLNEDGSPIAVAGVPPDYFAKRGQLWGNPLYDWPVNEADGYGWWTARFASTLRTVDAVRLDHFRGFESYWRVPAGDKDAMGGQWVPGPGASLFNHLQSALGSLPIVAEDLGVITPPVKALRDQFAFPGMRVLQFAFHQGANFYLPHLYPHNTVVYTGTHDNDTTIGWWSEVTPTEKRKALAYLGGEPDHISWALIRLALGSAADLAIYPLQDVLSLGREARMNTPGVPTGNWAWRLNQELTPKLAQRLLDLVRLFDRGHELPEQA